MRPAVFVLIVYVWGVAGLTPQTRYLTLYRTTKINCGMIERYGSIAVAFEVEGVMV